MIARNSMASRQVWSVIMMGVLVGMLMLSASGRSFVRGVPLDPPLQTAVLFLGGIVLAVFWVRPVLLMLFLLAYYVLFGFLTQQLSGFVFSKLDEGLMVFASSRIVAEVVLQKKKLPFKGIAMPALGFAGISLVSGWANGVSPVHIINSVSTYLKPVVFFFLMVLCVRREQERKILFYSILFVIFVQFAVVAIKAMRLRTFTADFATGTMGGGGHYNFGMISCFVALIGLFWAVLQGSRRSWWLVGLGLLGMIVAESKQTMATFPGAFVVGCFLLGYGGRNSWKTFFWVGAISLLGATTFAYLRPASKTAILRLAQGGLIERIGTVRVARLASRYALEEIPDWMIGIGPAQWTSAVGLKVHAPLLDRFGLLHRQVSADRTFVGQGGITCPYSSLLAMFVEVGLFGGLFFVGMYYATLKVARHGFARISDTRVRWTYAFFIFSMVEILIMSLFWWYLQTFLLMLPIWLLLAYAVGAVDTSSESIASNFEVQGYDG